MFIKSRINLDDEYVVMTRNYFLQYTQLEILEFRDTLMQHMESVKKSIDERALYKKDLVDIESSGKESNEQDTSNRSGNDAHADDADIRTIYDEEPMVEVQTTAKINVSATGQLHTEQPEFNNEGETVAQFQKDFLRMKAHCVNLELKYQNQTLKEGQHGQFSKVKSNEAKIKHDIDVIETINIELEHKVAKLLKENKTLKRHYKELSDSIKKMRAKTIEHTTSLIAQNAEFKAQLQERGFAIAALKNKWVPTRKIFTPSTTKVDSDPTNGSNEDFTNQYECEQTLDVSAGTLKLSADTSFNPKKEGLIVCLELGIHDHNNEQSSLKLVPKVVPSVDKTATSQQELELLFHHHITMLRSQQAATRNRGKEIVNSPLPIYDQEPDMVTEDDALSKEKEIDKLMALISLSFKKIYKPTNNNIKTSLNTIRANQDNSPRINKGTRYDNQRAVNIVGTRENVGTQVVWQSEIQCYNCKEYGHVARECQKSKRSKDSAYHKEKMILYQELEAPYMYMAKIQEDSLDDVDNSRPVFDIEPFQKVQNHDDNYNVFANDRQHPEQPESVNDTYPDEQGDNNIILDSLDMSTNGDQADHDDDDDLARERNLLAS
ncbi:integrase, catalytic region, zinc finger, CCHC-type containing protein [Tanacetum coccineum]